MADGETPDRLSHDALARSLADHLRGSDRMVWCDIQLGPAGSLRPDVYTLDKSFVRPHPMAYECKVTRADFRADVTSGKWQTYLKVACGVVFACEAGLIAPADVPEHCGLIVYRDGRWRSAKRAVLSPVIIPQNALLKLLIDGVEREGPRYRHRVWSDSLVYAKLSHRWGEIAAKTIRDRLAVEHEIEDRQRQARHIIDAANKSAERIRKEADVSPLRTELCELLGLKDGADRWTLESTLRELRASIQEHPAHASLRRFTESVQRALERDGWKQPTAELVQEEV